MVRSFDRRRTETAGAGQLVCERRIELTYETVRYRAAKLGQAIAKRIRSTAPVRGDKWQLEEMMVTIRGVKHWLWRAVDQHGAVLDVLVQRRRHATAVKRLMRKLLKRHGRPRVMMTDKLRSYAAANTALGLGIEHRQHEGLNNRAEDSHQPTRVREKVVRRFKSARQLQRFASVHGQVANLCMGCRCHRDAQQKLAARAQAMLAWERASCARLAA
nr:IS6 family transposase [Burkholderia gladioli]